MDYKKAYDRVKHEKLIMSSKYRTRWKKYFLVIYIGNTWQQLDVEMDTHRTNIKREVQQECVSSPLSPQKSPFSVYTQKIFLNKLKNYLD